MHRISAMPSLLVMARNLTNGSKRLTSWRPSIIGFISREYKLIIIATNSHMRIVAFEDVLTFFEVA